LAKSLDKSRRGFVIQADHSDSDRAMNASISQSTLNGLQASNGLSASGNNYLGEIVGSYFDDDDMIHGFLYSNGICISLDAPGAAQGTVAESINNSGEIVGYSYDRDNIAHGFLSVGGVFTIFDDPRSVFGSFAESITDSGDIVGFYYDADSQPQPFTTTVNAVLGVASDEETPSPDTADDDAPAKFWIAVQPTPLDDVAVPATEKPAAIPEDILDAIETEPAAKAKRAKSKSDKARMTKAGSGKSEPAAVGAPLQGVVARISGRLVEGWAQDPRNRETPVSLELVIEGIMVDLTVANRYRADLEMAGLGSGKHGFLFRLPPDLNLAQLASIEVRSAADHAALAYAKARNGPTPR
jgi:hypothetical protein